MQITYFHYILFPIAMAHSQFLCPQERKWPVPFNSCQCYLADHDRDNGHFSSQTCCCIGVSKIPQNLTKDMTTLILRKVDIMSILGADFETHDQLENIFIEDALRLTYVDGRAFSKSRTPKLRKLQINSCSLLKNVDNLDSILINRSISLLIHRTLLDQLPNFTYLISDNHQVNIDLSYNHIKRIRSKSLAGVKIQHLSLSFNEIHEVEGDVMTNAMIHMLSLNDNPLTDIAETAFENVGQLNILDLSRTKLKRIPGAGLDSLQRLILQETPTLKKLPSIETLRNLRKAELTYPFHCCYFKYPETLAKKQDDLLKQKNMFERLRESYCGGVLKTRRRRTLDDAEKRIDTIMAESICDLEDVQDLYDEFGEDFIKEYDTSQEIECTPQPDDLNPCEDLMHQKWLKISIWIVWIMAAIGNMTVIFVLCASQRIKHHVNHFLIINLSISDFFIGMYLAILAVQDARTAGHYYNFAVDWQTGPICKLAGFMAVFAGELSIATMVLISVEVWFNTKYLFYGYRFKLKAAVLFVALGYAVALVAAVLPATDAMSSYSSTSTCLPLRHKILSDKIYLASVLTLNLAAFIYIVFNYVNVYLMVARSGTPSAHRQNVSIAKRMAILIGTDFLCWAPTIFFGLVALTVKKSLISVSTSKILLVLFFPINSFANPFLYVFLTKMFLKDMSQLSRKYRWLRRLSSSTASLKNNYRDRIMTPNRLKQKRPSLSSYLISSTSIISRLTTFVSLSTITKKSRPGSATSPSNHLIDLSSSKSNALSDLRFSKRKRSKSLPQAKLDMILQDYRRTSSGRPSSSEIFSKFYIDSPPSCPTSPTAFSSSSTIPGNFVRELRRKSSPCILANVDRGQQQRSSTDSGSFCTKGRSRHCSESVLVQSRASSRCNDDVLPKIGNSIDSRTFMPAVFNNQPVPRSLFNRLLRMLKPSKRH